MRFITARTNGFIIPNYIFCYLESCASLAIRVLGISRSLGKLEGLENVSGVNSCGRELHTV